MTDPDYHFETSDFVSEMPEVFGHERMLVKNADASCKHAQMTAQHQAEALAGQSAPTGQAAQSMLANLPSMPHTFTTMDFQSFSPGFQGYSPHSGSYFSPNLMLWNNKDMGNEATPGHCVDEDDTFSAGIGTLPGLGSMSDSHGLTPTLIHPARNLKWCSHAEEPAGSSLWVGNKENVPVTLPEMAQIASSLGNPIEVPTDDTSEDAEEESTAHVKPKKKKQKVSACSLQLTSAHQRILNGSYPHFRFILITTKPWMDDKDNVTDEAALKAWFMQLDYLIANAGYQGRLNPTIEELKVISPIDIKQRQAQHRGEIKTAARLFLKFLPPEDASTIKHNQALVKALKTWSVFTFKGLFESLLLPFVIKQVYFNDGLKSEGLSFFGASHEIPFTVIALVFTAILCAIDEWQSGKHEPKSVLFQTATYEKPYNDILTSLKGWELYFCDTRKEPNVPVNFCKDLFKQGRLSAGVSDEDLNEDNPTASDDSIFGSADFAADFELVATM
ncbi:hypothetical protein F5146DRAFT_1007306 [Armillaria mellea]|nr:hypothetical protein F5146DRAFT_1007306 [Armillaria mellea]